MRKAYLRKENVELLEMCFCLKAHFRQTYNIKFKIDKNSVVYFKPYKLIESDRIFFYDVYVKSQSMHTYVYHKYSVSSFERHFMTQKKIRKAKLERLKTINQ